MNPKPDEKALIDLENLIKITMLQNLIIQITKKPKISKIFVKMKNNQKSTK